VLVFFAFFSVSVVAVTLTEASTNVLLSDPVRYQVSALKDRGKQLLTNEKKYEEAAQCYSAILQLVEGVSGEDAYELRRRCGLNLAFCNIQTGSYAAAVARCSEVIDESLNSLLSPNEDRTEQFGKDLKESLAIAHERRARALKLLKKVDFAEIDFKKAFKYGGKAMKEKKKDLYLKVKKLRFPASTEDLLRDFVEECQASHPRQPISKSAIQRLMNYNSFPASSGFGDVFGGGAGGLDFGSLLGSGDAGGNSPFGSGAMKLSNIVSFGAPLLGWSETTTKRVVMVAKAFETISEAVSKVARFISQHKEVITISFTVLWILYLAYNHYQSRG